NSRCGHRSRRSRDSVARMSRPSRMRAAHASPAKRHQARGCRRSGPAHGSERVKWWAWWAPCWARVAPMRRWRRPAVAVSTAGAMWRRGSHRRGADTTAAVTPAPAPVLTAHSRSRLARCGGSEPGREALPARPDSLLLQAPVFQQRLDAGVAAAEAAVQLGQIGAVATRKDGVAEQLARLV